MKYKTVIYKWTDLCVIVYDRYITYFQLDAWRGLLKSLLRVPSRYLI